MVNCAISRSPYATGSLTQGMSSQRRFPCESAPGRIAGFIPATGPNAKAVPGAEGYAGERRKIPARRQFEVKLLHQQGEHQQSCGTWSRSSTGSDSSLTLSITAVIKKGVSLDTLSVLVTHAPIRYRQWTVENSTLRNSSRPRADCCRGAPGWRKSGHRDCAQTGHPGNRYNFRV